MSVTITSRAAEAFNHEKYHLALDLYAFLAEKIGARNVEGNIQICSNRLSREWPMYFSEMNYEKLIKILGFEDAQNLIYADIDLNTIDGSAVWMSSMASILAKCGKTIIISKNRIKRNVVVDNLLSKNNIIILTPENIQEECDSLSPEFCVEFIRKLDNSMKNLRCIVIRGTATAKKLIENRKFYKRIYAYLTDFYEHNENGVALKPDASVIDVLARQSKAFLVQTKAIENVLKKATNFPIHAMELPPPVFDETLKNNRSKAPKISDEITIGYAGKIAPNWGIKNLVQWVVGLRKEGMKIKIIIIGDKISGAGNAEQNRNFRSEINKLLGECEAVRLGALSRVETLKKMEEVDYAWCWRPPEFENNTLELSTKLVEGVISGQACVAYPNTINVEALGKGYPFFAKNFEDFKNILKNRRKTVDIEIVENLHKKHAISNIARRFNENFGIKKKISNKKICIAAHDPKFILPYYSYLKDNGVPTVLDEWEWGGIIDEKRSRALSESSDVVFCEWGLANAVWYSKNLPREKKLIVRIHAQEVNKRAAKFGKEIDKDRVDLFIFVSDRVRKEAIRMFGFDLNKTVVIPNFVLDEEYSLIERSFEDVVRLGMVGIIPKQKRLDLAIDLLKEIQNRGFRAELKIKGPRPEELSWMKVGSRAKELEYYDELYEKIEKDSELKNAVKFYGWGNDVARFYEEVDYILSPSDSESFHYALADGVLSGCQPIVWPWKEAREIYNPSWIVENVSDAANKIIKYRENKIQYKIEEQKNNRKFIVEKYGFRKIFELLNEHVL